MKNDKLKRDCCLHRLKLFWQNLPQVIIFEIFIILKHCCDTSKLLVSYEKEDLFLNASLNILMYF